MDPIRIADIQLTEDEIEAAVAVLRTGALRQGPQCEAFEQEFAEASGARFALTCANGTAALHLAYLALLQPGDEVLVPAFTFIATASMVSVAGCTPVFCDVDPETWLIDLDDARRKVTERTKAIVPVHLFGNVCDIEACQTFAADHGLTVIWDGAQAHGATYKGQDQGSFDEVVCYSFYPTKNMFTGEGGMLTTNDEELAYKLRYLRSHGQTGTYVHTMMGLNYRMTDVEAAIGRKQLARLPAMLAARRRNAGLLNEGIAGIPGLQPQRITPGVESAWHQYCVLVDEAAFGCGRDELAKRLNERGIGTAVYYPVGLHKQPVFQEQYGDLTLPVTEDLCGRILALPIHHGLSEVQMTAVLEGLDAARQG